MSRARRWLLRTIRVLAGSALLLVAALVAMLARGPIGLDLLRPTLERSLSPPDGSFRVQLTTIALAWNAEERKPEIRSTGVRVIGHEGRTVVEIPAVDVRLKRSALLRGRIVPVHVGLRDARLTVVRDADGSLDLGIADGAPARGERVDLRAMVDGLAQRAATEAPLRLSAHGAEIAIVDQRSAETWRLTGADLVLEPNAHGLDGSLTGDLEVAAHRVPIRGAARYRVGRDHGTVTLGFRRLPPQLLGDLPLWNDDAGPPAWATALQMPLDGAVAVTLNAALRPTAARGRIRGAAGVVQVPGDAVARIDVTRLRLRGRLDVTGRRLDVRRLALGLGASRLDAVGSLAWAEDGGILVEATTHAERLPLDLLDRWWPPTAAPQVRRWVVEKRRGGVFTTAELELGATIDSGSRRASLQLRRGTARFDGVGLDYDERLPALADANGSVRLDERGWTLRADRGRIGAIELAGASGVFPLGEGGSSRARLTAALRGPLREALAILDREPFGYARALGIAPRAVAGTMTARLEIEPPAAESRLPVALSGDAHLTRVGTDGIIAGLPLHDGDLSLKFEPKGVQATGTARVADTPIAFTWNEDATAAEPARQVTVTGRLASEARRLLGFDLAPWVDGPMAVEAHVATSRGNGTLDVSVQLDETRIVSGIGRLAKPTGAPGRAEARFTLESNDVTRAERLFLEAGPATVTGTAARPNGWDDVRLEADIAGVSPQAPRGRCTLAVDRQRGGHGFRLSSDDAGALISAVGGGEGLRNGSLVLAGTAVPAAPGTDTTATLEIRNAVFTESSVLRRIVALGSLSSLESAFTGAGLPFDRLAATLRHRDPIVYVIDGVAHGSALTVVVDGTIDRPSATMDLKGTLIPSYYGLNTAPGRIPVVGNLIGRGDAKGIQAIDFTARGPLREPQVQVKALSAIAPGVLRDVLRKLRR